MLQYTFISTKLSFATKRSWKCVINYQIPNCDDVMNVTTTNSKRILKKSYWSGGMGDGGGCHPRDNMGSVGYHEN